MKEVSGGDHTIRDKKGTISAYSYMLSWWIAPRRGYKYIQGSYRRPFENISIYCYRTDADQMLHSFPLLIFYPAARMKNNWRQRGALTIKTLFYSSKIVYNFTTSIKRPHWLLLRVLLLCHQTPLSRLTLVQNGTTVLRSTAEHVWFLLLLPLLCSHTQIAPRPRDSFWSKGEGGKVIRFHISWP